MSGLGRRINRHVKAGRFYAVLGNGHHVEVPEHKPDVWACRRLADFPDGTLPDSAGVASCTRCSAQIAFNAAREVDAPKVCLQCAGYEPEPLEVLS